MWEQLAVAVIIEMIRRRGIRIDSVKDMEGLYKEVKNRPHVHEIITRLIADVIDTALLRKEK